MSEPLYLRAMITVEARHASEAEQVMLKCVESSRKEKACKEYRFFRDLDHKGRFFTQEIWASKEGLDAHSASPHFQMLAATIKKFNGDLAVAMVSPLEPGV